MYFIKNKYFTLSLLILPLLIAGQNIKDTSIYAPLFSINYAYQLPEGDLKDRFGLNHNLGFSSGIKLSSSWIFDIHGNFIFGQNVKDTTIIDHLQNSQGWIINQYGEENRVLIHERGLTLSFQVGKIFDFIGPNPNSGLLIKAGIGIIRHKIKIENENNLVPQLNPEKLPYYDRLTMGLLIKEFIGYQHMSNNRLTNFYIGIEASQGLTRGMRDYQIDLMAPLKEKRLDLLFGIRLGWIIPVFRQAPQEFYIN